MGSIRYRPHAQLMTLAVALAPAEETTSWTCEELVLRAHRLRERAALFERRTALAKLVRLVAATGPDDCGAGAG
jgi:hypothetical protein